MSDMNHLKKGDQKIAWQLLEEVNREEGPEDPTETMNFWFFSKHSTEIDKFVFRTSQIKPFWGDSED